MSKSNQLIQRLLEAEEDAERIVKRARDNRVKKLKEAQDAAQEEIEYYRKKEEKRFQKEFSEKYGNEADEEALIEEQIKKEIDLVKKDYKVNHEAVVSFLVRNCVNVNVKLSQAELRRIEMHFKRVAA
ncbi:MAG: hypothetical protein KVP17_000788 [Porospora cf. gigantea B]|uniref:uncharacterized protein n=1 Tax=Porospora cf. gigantea A TaxID=2853593 RepID=UPI0035598774|nr:MAG: hypothetical protein KVP17_000788 [Porospora cf. gigantea B]KAH0485742.1 MAG: hypothetical protein KVP18_004221 [Porospora cf. gigantea A]